MNSNKMLTTAFMAAIGVIVIALAVILVGNESESETTLPEPGLISPQEYQHLFVDANVDHFLLDVRTVAEYNGGHIARAVNIPAEILNRYLGNIPANQPIVVYCRSGNRSAEMVTLLQNAGFTDVYDIIGGINEWAEQGLPLHIP